MKTLSICASIMLVGIQTAVARAGDLNPPPGPVAPTLKTLVEVEPRTVINAVNTPGDANSVYKITQSGSYYLDANLLGANQKSGIEIAASGVTVDLMGFEVTGIVLPPARSLTGIHVSQAGAINVVIRNGSVRGWGGGGVVASTANSIVIEDLVVSQNTGVGISAGDNTTIRRVQSSNSPGNGIIVGASSRVSDTIASNNSLLGIIIGTSSTIESCTFNANTTGVSAGEGCQIRDTTANDNSVDGFNVGRVALLERCIARNSGGTGITTVDMARIIDCIASQNAIDGIAVQGRSLITGCAADFNGSNGIEGTGGQTTVRNCRTAFNTFPSIALLDGNNRVEGCTVNSEGATASTGIIISGSNCIALNNHVTDFSLGIDATGFGTLVVKNIVAGCTITISVTGGAVGGAVVTSLFGAGPWDNIAP